MIAFFYYFAALGVIFSVSLILPILVGFGFSETEIAYRLTMYCALGIFFFGAALLAILGRLEGLNRNIAILLAVTSWTAFPFLLAIPIADVSNLTYLDALFECVSGLTTTGASVFANLESVPKSVIVYRAQLQWLGGMGTLITLVLVLAPWSIGGLPHASTASVAASIVASHTRLVKFCGQLLRTFLAITAACFVCLILTGVDTFSSLILSLTALSTGGFLPSDQSPDELLGSGGMMIFSVFLIFGATSIFWHRQIYSLRLDDLLAHRESYYVVGVWLIVSAFIAVTLYRAAGSSSVLAPTTAISEGLFNAASLITTSGIQSRPGAFTVMPAILVLMMLLIGAGCYSTAGGIKFFRVGGMISLAVHELNRLIYPHAIRPTRFGSIRYEDQNMKAIWSFFGSIIVLVAIASCMLSASGMGFQAGFTATIAAVTNAGPAYGQEWAPANDVNWPLFGDMNEFQKIILCIVMILGRLEIIAAIACINLAFQFRK